MPPALYQVAASSATHGRNGRRFRRRRSKFLRGDDGSVGKIADRCWQPEVYGHKQREAEASINFVAATTGSSLNDSCTYNQKHNERTVRVIATAATTTQLELRRRRTDRRSIDRENSAIAKSRNFLTLTMLSLGIPMILTGDEVRRNAVRQQQRYCQDDRVELVRLDTSAEARRDIHRFTQLLIARRVLRDVSSNDTRGSYDLVCVKRTTAMARREAVAAGLELQFA